LTVADGLSSNNLSALYEDDAGVLWVGSLDGGLNRLAPGPNGMTITRFTTANGLTSNTIYQILPDDQGFFWISCHLGVYRVQKQELDDFAAGRITRLNSTLFGRADGFINPECTYGGQPAGFRARDGSLWFPTHDGLAMIDPRRVRSNPTPPPVLIEEALLDRQAAALQSGLRIRPGQGNLEINYTALSFIKPEQIRFRYKMEGLDHDWVEAGTRRTAYYPHLPSGSYTFKVIAANSDGVWNTAGQSLRITALPPFYRTWWFLMLAGLGVAGLITLAWRYRVAQFERRQAAQQAFARQLIASQEAERKRIAAELHDSLSQSLVIIKNRALMALQAPVNLERATAQLEEIAESSVSAIDEVREIAYALRPFHLDRLGLTKAIAEMVEKMTEAHRLQATLNLISLDGLWSPEVEINLYRIVQESLNNIARHAQATTCRITARREGRTIELEIADNGRGFSLNEPVANPGFQIPNSKSGFGLLGMAERVRLLGGQWQIQSAPGAGTTIIIKLSVPDKDTPLTGKQTDES
jgi:signal transduction histidine kinase